MIFRCLLIFLFCLFGANSAISQQDSVQISAAHSLTFISNIDSLQIATPHSNGNQDQKFEYRKSKRFTAALLCLTLGPFGMHRLYLGTSPNVAAAYSVTLGGIGLVPVIDLLLITFSKDLERFKNNDRVIMWGK